MENLGWSGAGIFFALGIDFIFYLLAGRFLGPEEFGLFGAAMAIYYVTVRPLFRSLEMASKKVSAEGSNAIKNLGLYSIKIGFLMWVLFLIFIPISSNLMDLSPILLGVFSLVFPFAYFLAVLIGHVQGEENFKLYASYEVIGSTAKFSAIFLIFFTGLEATAAISGTVSEILIGSLFVFIVLKPLRFGKKVLDNGLLFRSALFIVAIYSAFSFDILILKIFNSAETVGLYNAVSVLGKAIFFGAVAVNRSVFPKFVKDKQNGKKLLNFSIVLILLGGSSFSVFFQIFGKEFLRIVYGSSYLAASSFSPFYMLFITLVSVVALLGNYYISLEKRIWPILMMPFTQLLGLLTFHETINQVLAVSILSALSGILVLYLPLLIDRSEFRKI